MNKKADKKKASAGKKVWRGFKYLLLAGVVAGAAFIVYVLFQDTPERDVWDFVPEKSVFVVEADDPIENWKSLSKTPMWKHLKKNELFADIEGDANFLDTLIHDNEAIFDLMAGKKVLICAQMTKSDDYDFTYLVDLEKASKVTNFIPIFKPIMKGVGYPLIDAELGGRDIYKINDGADDIYMAFIDNILAMSYSTKLLLGVIEQEKKPFYSKNTTFIEVRDGAYDEANRNSIGKVHLNFDQLDEYMSVFMDEVSGSLVDLSTSMQYSSMDLKVDDDFVEMVGPVSIDTGNMTLATVLLQQDRGEIRAPLALPTNTSFLLSIDYGNFEDFYGSIGEIMKDDADYNDFEKTKNSIGKLLGVNASDRKKKRAEKKGKDRDYFDWLGSEIALAMIPHEDKPNEQAYVTLFHTPDYANAFHDLNAIAKKIRRRTPVKFKDYEYRGKEIRWLAMKGFFKLFLGRLFKQFDKPKFTILDDFVVFSNDTTAIHRIIDASMADETLYGEENYRRINRNFSDESNYFIYINTARLYPHLPSLLDAESARDLRKNKKYVTCFSFAAMQLTSDDEAFDTEIYLEYKDPN